MTAQHRILPGDPHAPATDLAIGNAPQVRAKQIADRRKYFFNGAKADAADEMHRREWA
jgi:hypothetical protein